MRERGKLVPGGLRARTKNEARVAGPARERNGRKDTGEMPEARVQQAGEVAARDFFFPAPLRFLRFCTLE